MSISFPRTMRARTADHARSTWVGLLIAMAILLLWLAWFWGARITFIETSQRIQAANDTMIVADFASTAQAHLRVGQAASAHLVNNAVIPVVVWQITPQSDGSVRVQFVPRRDTPSTPIFRAAPIQVEIETESVSPATLLMRAINRR